MTVQYATWQGSMSSVTQFLRVLVSFPFVSHQISLWVYHWVAFMMKYRQGLPSWKNAIEEKLKQKLISGLLSLPRRFIHSACKHMTGFTTSTEMNEMPNKRTSYSQFLTHQKWPRITGWQWSMPMCMPMFRKWPLSRLVRRPSILKRKSPWSIWRDASSGTTCREPASTFIDLYQPSST